MRRGLRAGIVCVAALLLAGTAASHAQAPTVLPPEAASPASFAVTRVAISPDREADDWGMGMRGRNFWAVHVTVKELICWAYGISPAQVEAGPEWIAQERFDVDGVPDAADPLPTGEQQRAMLRSALADRFALTLRSVTKPMPVYVLTVDGRSVKPAPSADAAARTSWGIHRGWLSVTNMTFQGVASVMQRTVFDRPVLNRTGLTGRYSFVLRWRADETQFTQMQGIDMPEESGTDDVNDIYTSARQQLGLKITAAKQVAPAYVIERISRPSSN